MTLKVHQQDGGHTVSGMTLGPAAVVANGLTMSGEMSLIGLRWGV